MTLHKGIRIHQYLDDWLVRDQIPPNLSAAYRNPSRSVLGAGLDGKPGKFGTGPKTSFHLQEGNVRPTIEHWQTFKKKIQELLSTPACPVRQLMSLIGLLTATEKQVHLGQLHMRPIQWHLKKNWRVPESLEKVVPVPRSLYPHLSYRRKTMFKVNHYTLQSWSANVYRCIKRRVEPPLRGTYCKGNLVPSREQVAYKIPGTKLDIYGSKRVARPLLSQESSCCYRQHHSGVLHKQRRRHEVVLTVCPFVEYPDLMLQKTGYSQIPAHSRPAEYGSR